MAQDLEHNYDNVTQERLNSILREQYYGNEDAQERRITIQCFSQACVDAFDKAIKDAANRLDITLTNEE